MNKMQNNSIIGAVPRKTTVMRIAACVILFSLPACSAGDIDEVSASRIMPSVVTNETSPIQQSFHLLETVIVTVEQYVQTASDPELSAAWESARKARSAPDVRDFAETLRVSEETSSIDPDSPIVVAYLNSLVPVLTELQTRYDDDALVEPLNLAYSQFSEQRTLTNDTAADTHEKKKRPHCCTSPVGHCIEVNDNDLASFFECAGEIQGSFTISRGHCTCAPIDYE